MGERLRTALLGCGRWGKSLLRNFAGREDIDVRVVVDPDALALAGARAIVPGAHLAASEDALDREPLDVVVIASPGPVHARQALEAMDRGADVFVEKPMATAFDDAQEIVKKAAAQGTIGMVGHLLAYHPAIAAMIGAALGGEIGKPLYLRSERCCLAGSPDPDGSLLWALAPHDVSLLRAIDPSPVVTVDTEMRRGGAVATLNLRTERGMRASVLMSRMHEHKVRRTVVECEAGWIVFDDTLARNKLVVHRKGGGAREPIAYDDSIEPLRAEIDYFVRCVRDRRAPPTGFDDGLAVVAVLARAELAAVWSISRPAEVADR